MTKFQNLAKFEEKNQKIFTENMQSLTSICRNVYAWIGLIFIMIAYQTDTRMYIDPKNRSNQRYMTYLIAVLNVI